MSAQSMLPSIQFCSVGNFMDLYRVSYSKRDSVDFTKSDNLSRQIMLTSLTKFRVENFCIFLVVGNVINDAHVNLFDP